jgi:hypothetical protein
MFKTMSAVATAAIVAGCFVAFPSLSPTVEASASAASGKSDRADARPLATECSQREWPYFEALCLRNANNPLGEARTVRFVSVN